MESCSSRLAPPLTTRSTIRSPQLSGQRPPDPPSPLGGSVETCCGLANGSATLPHFCCPVSSPIPLSPECTRIGRRGTLVQDLCPFGMLDRPAIRYQGTKVPPVELAATRASTRIGKRIACVPFAAKAPETGERTCRTRVMDRTGLRGEARRRRARAGRQGSRLAATCPPTSGSFTDEAVKPWIPVAPADHGHERGAPRAARAGRRRH